MSKKEERMEILKNAGVNTNKYFTISLPEGLKAGSNIQLIINENGQPVIYPITGNHDEITEQIIENGYVRNTKLHRRWVMAQVFRMLNHNAYGVVGYDQYLKQYYPYHYQFTMMLEEFFVLSRLESSDEESFKERSHFFTKEVVIATCDDYMNKLHAYVDSLPIKRCKGVPYKRIKGKDIFVTDLQGKLYNPLEAAIRRIRSANNYGELYRFLDRFVIQMIKLPYGYTKSKIWIDAFKGSGAYYTLKNLVMYHGCGIFTVYGNFYGMDAVRYLNMKLDEYKREGWRFMAMLKKCIADNHFDFDARMREIYSEK